MCYVFLEGGTWCRVLKGGANGGLGDGCLRSPVSEGTLVCSRMSSETENLEEKYLVGVLLIMKEASAWFRRSWESGGL